ncbi:MAG TPA: hypothetical protein VFR42_07780 [Candidatus Acidoferrum sp.]|nr:hypothetical protein [Candidatus Acidoferrum sp.]
MTRAQINIALLVIAGMFLRDAWCWSVAKFFCWRKQRQTQRRVKQDRELRALQSQLVSVEELEKDARIAKVMLAASKVPYPQLLAGPLIVKARCNHEVLLITKQMQRNFAAQGKQIVDGNFEDN